MQELGRNERVNMQETARINVNANNIKDRRDKRKEKKKMNQGRIAALENIGAGNSKLFAGNLNNQQSLMSLSSPKTAKKADRSRSRSGLKHGHDKRHKRYKRYKKRKRLSSSSSS